MIALADLKTWLGVGTTTPAQDAALVALEARAVDAVERALDWYFGTPRPCIEILSGNGRTRLYLHQPPVPAEPVTVEVRTGIGEVDWEALDADYWESAGRCLYHRCGWPWGTRNIRVTYQEGFIAPPGDVEQLVYDLVAAQTSVDSGELSGETIGDYSYTKADVEAASSWPSVWQHWRRGRL